MNYDFLARLVADLAIFFEKTDEEFMDLDTSVDGTGIVVYHIKKLNEDEIGELCKALRVVANEYDGEAREFVGDLPELLGLIDSEDEDDDEGHSPPP